MVNQQKMIDQLKKQIRDLRKSNIDLEQQLKTTKENKINPNDISFFFFEGY
jgi:cell division protein FtsB